MFQIVQSSSEIFESHVLFVLSGQKFLDFVKNKQKVWNTHL